MASSTVNSIRQAALQDTASSVAAQAALAQRSKQINMVLQSQSRSLERIFNFDAMLLNHNVLPPVLVEARDTLNLDDSITIRLADRDYQITYPARFVTASPTWHDYLWMNYEKPEPPNITLLPKNKIEKNLWRQYIQEGWKAGSQQAMDIFSANLSRLQRDFNGMVLYRKLYAQNIVSAPFVSEADLGITGGGDALRVNDRILRITAMSELKPNSTKWNAVLDKKKKSFDVKKDEKYSKTQKKSPSAAKRQNCKKSFSLREILNKL